MMAAYAAAESGHAVTLLEQNEKLGKKLFITGKGRCNLTNASDMEQLFANVVSNRKFLYSAFYSYDNEQVVSFFESHGMPTKTERGNRVFPVSDHSSDVIAALSTALRGQHVEVFLHTKVKRLLLEKRDEEKRVTGVELADHTKMHADAVIVATGGISYPSTGATGDGYRMAEESGHKMVSPTPALVPMAGNTERHSHPVHGLITADYSQQKFLSTFSQAFRTGPGSRDQTGTSMGLRSSVDVIQLQGVGKHGIYHGCHGRRISAGLAPDMGTTQFFYLSPVLRLFSVPQILSI